MTEKEVAMTEKEVEYEVHYLALADVIVDKEQNEALTIALTFVFDPDLAGEELARQTAIFDRLRELENAPSQNKPYKGVNVGARLSFMEKLVTMLEDLEVRAGED